MKLNFKFTTTAAFLLSTLLIAGCAGNTAPEESLPPESASPAPFSDTSISSGIQTGAQAEAAAALLGDWELDKAETTPEGEESPQPVEVENARTYTFREDGTGSVQYPDGAVGFEYAVQGTYLTLVMDDGGLEMYWAAYDGDGALLLTRMNNDGSMQPLVEHFTHPEE